jgi:hypothetical protein
MDILHKNMAWRSIWTNYRFYKDTNIVISNPVHGEVYSLQRYVIKFVSDLR